MPHRTCADDCCSDYADVCTASESTVSGQSEKQKQDNNVASCHGDCGTTRARALRGGGYCWCDEFCQENTSNCCGDYAAECSPDYPDLSPSGFLEAAGNIFNATFLDAWDETHCGGGLWWKKGTFKSTISTALALRASIGLHASIPGDVFYGQVIKIQSNTKMQILTPPARSRCSERNKYSLGYSGLESSTWRLGKFMMASIATASQMVGQVVICKECSSRLSSSCTKHPTVQIHHYG